MLTTRRSLITGLATLLAAPAIVRASSIMPVRAFDYGTVRVLIEPGIDPIGSLGLAPIKQEGASIYFDPGTREPRRYRAGEPIFIGNIVAPRRDGRVYRVRGTESDLSILGIVVG